MMNTEKLDKTEKSENQALGQYECIVEMLDAYDKAENDTEREEAEKVLTDKALSVEVRSGWMPLDCTLQAEEYCILLCTGGPAVRIVGALNMHDEPDSARIEHQDWGTPWAELWAGVDEDVLLRYVGFFYFGQ